MNYCANCKQVFPSPAPAACDACGGVINVEIQLTGIEVKSIAGTLGTCTDEPVSDGRKRVVSPPSGAKAVLFQRGSSFSGDVKPPVDIGKQRERPILGMVQSELIASYCDVTAENHDDAAGEDARFVVRGDPVSVQVSTVTPRDDFFEGVRHGGAHYDLTATEAAERIHIALKKKHEKQHKCYQDGNRNGMLVVLDMWHLDQVMREPNVSAVYLSIYGDPIVEYGFAGVWLIGSTDVHKLGSSRW